MTDEQKPSFWESFLSLVVSTVFYTVIVFIVIMGIRGLLGK